MDPRRELTHIRKNYRQYHRTIGEFIVWFPYIKTGTDGVVYDDIYDEGNYLTGGKTYETGISVPVLMITETEDTKRAIPEGRQPVQVVNVVMSIEDMSTAGVPEPFEYQRHLNDMFFYDARYYSVSMYRVRGRAKDDVLVVVEGLEVYIDQEMVNDPGPMPMAVQSHPWPANFPILT